MLNKIHFFLISLKAKINHPLNRKKRVRAMFTFLFWQILLRVLKQKGIFAWLFDAKFYYDLFDFNGNQIFIKNEDVIFKRLLEMNSKYYIENLFT